LTEHYEIQHNDTGHYEILHN
jgi:ATP-dependent RNA helicase SUPV3L1/SUV3